MTKIVKCIAKNSTLTGDFMNNILGVIENEFYQVLDEDVEFYYIQNSHGNKEWYSKKAFEICGK